MYCFKAASQVRRKRNLLKPSAYVFQYMKSNNSVYYSICCCNIFTMHFRIDCFVRRTMHSLWSVFVYESGVQSVFVYQSRNIQFIVYSYFRLCSLNTQDNLLSRDSVLIDSLRRSIGSYFKFGPKTIVYVVSVETIYRRIFCVCVRKDNSLYGYNK